MRSHSTLCWALALTLACAVAGAAPAPYWQWRSKLDGRSVCSQTPLGQGWEKLAGPFRDARCEVPIRMR